MLPFIAYRVPGSTMDSRAESGFHWIESTNLCRHVLPRRSMSIHLLHGCITPVFDPRHSHVQTQSRGRFPESDATAPCVRMWQGAACCQGVPRDASVDGQLHERQTAPHTGFGGRRLGALADLQARLLARRDHLHGHRYAQTPPTRGSERSLEGLSSGAPRPCKAHVRPFRGNADRPTPVDTSAWHGSRCHVVPSALWRQPLQRPRGHDLLLVHLFLLPHDHLLYG